MASISLPKPKRAWTYVVAGVVVLAVSLLGFLPFYALLLMGRIHHGWAFALPHGLLMTGWCVLFVVQAGLARAGQVRSHVRLGRLGVGLGVLILIDGVLTSVTSTRLGGPHLFAPPADQLAFLFGMLTAFAVLGGLGLALRRREGHGWLMVIAALSLLPAGLIRLQSPPPFPLSPPALIVITDLVILSFGGMHLALRRRLGGGFALGLGLLIVMQLLVLILARSPVWASLTRAMLAGG